MTAPEVSLTCTRMVPVARCACNGDVGKRASERIAKDSAPSTYLSAAFSLISELLRRPLFSLSDKSLHDLSLLKKAICFRMSVQTLSSIMIERCRVHFLRMRAGIGRIVTAGSF